MEERYSVEWKVVVPEPVEDPWSTHSDEVDWTEANRIFEELDSDINGDPDDSEANHLPIRIVNEFGEVVRSNFA